MLKTNRRRSIWCLVRMSSSQRQRVVMLVKISEDRSLKVVCVCLFNV